MISDIGKVAILFLAACTLQAHSPFKTKDEMKQQMGPPTVTTVIALQRHSYSHIIHICLILAKVSLPTAGQSKAIERHCISRPTNPNTIPSVSSLLQGIQLALKSRSWRLTTGSGVPAPPSPPPPDTYMVTWFFL